MELQLVTVLLSDAYVIHDATFCSSTWQKMHALYCGKAGESHEHHIRGEDVNRGPCGGA